MAEMFKVFQGDIKEIKSEINEWFRTNPQVQIRKMCMTSILDGKFLSVLIFFTSPGGDHSTQMVEIFQSADKGVEGYMNKWCKERPKIRIKKMRMTGGGLGGRLLTVLVLYSQPEPEIC